MSKSCSARTVRGAGLASPSFRRRLTALILPLLALLLSPSPGRSETADRIGRAAGQIAGRVLASDGAPVPGVEVRLVDLRRRTTSDAEGRFRFDGVAAGEYLIEASSAGRGAAIDRIVVAPGVVAEIGLTLDLAVHRDEIVVTASPDARSQDELAQATTVLDANALAREIQGTIGETLANQPGVASSSWGAGASRPVIRGLGGDRIRVLQGGIGTGDASTTSPDHAVSFDPELAERIEIVRGPATLRYGGSATGGVVNVIDGKVPNYAPGRPLAGTVDLRAGSNANEQVGAAALTGGVGRIAWHLEGVRREADDYEAGDGVVGNSAVESTSQGAGISYIGAAGYLGVAASSFDSHYGSPLEEKVAIDLEQRRLDLEGELDRSFGFVKAVKLRAGRTDYEHVELEGVEVGTRFLNESWEGRLEAIQKPFGRLSGSFGLQVSNRDFRAIGEESFVPPTETDARALFAFEEIASGPLRYQLGLRYDEQRIDADAPDGRLRRDLSGLSGSVGAVVLPNDDWSIGFSLSRSVKLPNAEELFSNGPHIATGAFEIGDPTLRKETNLGVDLSVRRRSGRLTGEVSLYANRFDDFIFERITGETVGGEDEEPLQVIRFTQADARLRGAEISAVYELYHGEPDHLDVEFGADFVRGELAGAAAGPLPRIPPARYRLALHYRGGRLQGKIEGIRVERQNRLAEFETTTEGYDLLNADVSVRFLVGPAVLDVLLRGRNLTDELARNHISFLKDVAPLPGRDVTLGLRVGF